MFYCLHEGYYDGVKIRIDQIKTACKQHNIEFLALNSLTFDYTNLPVLSKSDFLYNAARGSNTLESLLLNEDVTTFYLKNPLLNQTYSTTDWSILHDKANLPSPVTIFNITTDRVLLTKYVEYLGGFPIVIKAAGSTRGIGTIKIETWHNLISTVDYLKNVGDKFILRQFIKAQNGCRLITLGKEVVAGADFAMNLNDFRNAVDLEQVKYTKRSYPQFLKDIAVKATEIANLEFAGVDFLEDDKGNFSLLEVNFPTGFSSLIDVCGVDIPLKMVEYLMKKSNI